MDPTNRDDTPVDRPSGATVHPLRRRVEQDAGAGVAFREPEPEEEEFAGYTMGAAVGGGVDESVEEYESFGFAEVEPAAPGRGLDDARSRSVALEEIAEPLAEPSPARVARRGLAGQQRQRAVRDGRASEANGRGEGPRVGTASHSALGRRRAAVGALTVVVVVLAVVGVNALAGQRATPRVAARASLASASKIQTPLLAPIAANFARGYAMVGSATRGVGVKVKLVAARRRRELLLRRRREAQAAAAQAARAQTAVAAQTTQGERSGSSGGASAPSYVPRATSPASSSSQSSSGTAKSGGSSSSAGTSRPLRRRFATPGRLAAGRAGRRLSDGIDQGKGAAMLGSAGAPRCGPRPYRS